MSEIQTVEEQCKHEDCVFLGKVSVPDYGMTPCCDYILLTREPRGCSIENCDKYRTGRRIKKPSIAIYNNWEVEFDD